MTLRLCCLILLAACCGVSNASDDEVEVCRGHCRTIAIVMVPDLYTSTDTAEASERKRGDNRGIPPHRASSRDLMPLDLHTFCTTLCQQMQKDEVMQELCVPNQEYESSEDDGEEETEEEDRIRRRKPSRARKTTAARRGTHGKRARAARRRHAH